MWPIILETYLFISALFAALFWFVMIVAKRSDEKIRELIDSRTR